MSVIDYENEKSPFTPSGDLQDESNLNEILMDLTEDDDDDVAEPGEIEEIDDDGVADDEIDDEETEEDGESADEFN
jgi:hypothetical protein